MTRKERLLATLQGKPVDRPAVNFYELNGLDENPDDRDPFNIYSHPSWKPLIDLTREKTDRLVMRGARLKDSPPDPIAEITHTAEHYDEQGSLHVTRTIKLPDRVLTSRSRRDRDVNTWWQTEHPLKDPGDLEAYLDLPIPEFGGTIDQGPILEAERKLGDTGMVMIDIADPLCRAAELFSMSEYTIVALTEQKLFRRALDRFAAILLPKVEAAAKALPGRLWRIVGPEYASPPYLPPSLFREYIVHYDTMMVDLIQKHGGYARLHSHGRLHDILDDIVRTGCSGLDPIEPLPQGDVELSYVREKYGKQLVLFGNLEIADIENLPTADFEKKVTQAITQGTAGQGRGFVLMPSACPYGRVLSTQTLRNYEKMIEIIEKY
jgi:hypothetical protein